MSTQPNGRKGSKQSTTSLTPSSRAKTLASKVKALELENNNLRDEVADLKVIEAKFHQQAVLVKHLQQRIENLNHLINNGHERARATTLTDVRKLTGEIESKQDLPSFNDLSQQVRDSKV